MDYVSEKARRVVATRWLVRVSRVVGVYVMTNMVFLVSCTNSFKPEMPPGVVLGFSLFFSLCGTLLWYGLKPLMGTALEQLRDGYITECREYDRDGEHNS